jgi:RimJ/RimL family protein N-acetyltransferase
MKSTAYLFQSARLGFRPWSKADLYPMAAINADEQVMEFFSSIQNEFQTETFIQKMQEVFTLHQYCYFAVELLETQEFIGFIGLCPQTYKSPFTPCVDIGWRLTPTAWGKGYATEGAQRCLDYAFQQLKMTEVYAMAPFINQKSIAVMIKLGMEFCGNFIHPALMDDSRLADCVCYKITAPKLENHHPLEKNPFQYKIVKDDKIIIYRNQQQIMIVKGRGAADLIDLARFSNEITMQLALAKITGNYKRGNES